MCGAVRRYTPSVASADARIWVGQASRRKNRIERRDQGNNERAKRERETLEFQQNATLTDEFKKKKKKKKVARGELSERARGIRAAAAATAAQCH